MPSMRACARCRRRTSREHSALHEVGRVTGALPVTSRARRDVGPRRRSGSYRTACGSGLRRHLRAPPRSSHRESSGSRCAAQVAADRRLWSSKRGRQGVRRAASPGHQHAGMQKSALHRAAGDVGLLERVQSSPRASPSDRGDVAAVRHAWAGTRHDITAGAVEPHGACPALAFGAAFLGRRSGRHLRAEPRAVLRAGTLERRTARR